MWDYVIGGVVDVSGPAEYWGSLHAALRADDHALHHRLIRLHDQLGLPPQISALRVFEVIAWREGRDRNYFY
ncbi:MAG: hypothetical protein DIU79_13815 [Actinobacteria bacterium]|nr:MAG: hypothetical protein DIU79_13815 [Actinomycetota bacterium]